MFKEKKIYCRICCLVISFAFIVSSAISQTQSDDISVEVSLDHPQWGYHPGEKALFSIAVLKAGKPLENVVLHYEIGPEKMKPTLSNDLLTTKNAETVDGGTLKQPGFLRCTVTAEIDGKKYRGLATAAYSPESIKPSAKMPDDFLQFWANAKTSANKIPLDSKVRLIPERSTGNINMYEVSIQNYQIGTRVYGILSVPKKPGKYPAILRVPGAGIRAYKGDSALAERGLVTLEIGIHGIPVTMPDQVYYDLAKGALHDYFLFNLDSRDHYYYKRVYLGCLRAIDYLYSLPEVDTSRVAVYGGSQGGALSIVTAALDNRIKYLSAFYPALADLTGYLNGRAGGWPAMFDSSHMSFMGTKDKIANSGYYDVVNFAKQIKIPGFYGWGFNDEVCPPTSIYAAYNSIKASKELMITKEAGHRMSPEQAEKLKTWLLEKLQAGK